MAKFNVWIRTIGQYFPEKESAVHNLNGPLNSYSYDKPYYLSTMFGGVGRIGLTEDKLLFVSDDVIEDSLLHWMYELGNPFKGNIK